MSPENKRIVSKHVLYAIRQVIAIIVCCFGERKFAYCININQ